MRWNSCLISISLAAALASVAAPSLAATFGTVVPIGGPASDIALDESRGVLYIANFTANRIEVMSTADDSIRSSMNVAPQPGALALSFDSQFLLIAHYGNHTQPNPSGNAVTLINLNSNTRQTFTTGDPPLGVAFTADGMALIVTTSSFVALDPISGAMQVLATFATLGQTLPTSLNTFPAQVISAALATSADGSTVYGIAGAATGQAFYRYNARGHQLYAIGIVASPKPLPRVSVAADGSWCIIGQYRLDPWATDLAQFPNSITSTNIGGNAVDSKAGIIYAQILTVSTQTSASAIPATTPAAQAPPATPPVLSILDADNLTVRDTLSLPENMVGRAVLSAAGDMLYAITDSGVTVLPVGKLKQYHRLAASPTDLVAQNNFCNRSVITLNLTISDPGGGNTDFFISSYANGVTISPSSGITPATVQVRVDPTAYQDRKGTVNVPLTISSATAVNLPPVVRLLVNSRDPDQRGTTVDIPGTLVDILADPARSRFYVLQQDRNQVLVFDGATYQQITALRTATTPTQMAMTFDRKYLLIGHDNSQLAFVYDLDTFQQQTSIAFPAGHYPRSLAASGKALLALVRNAGAGGSGMVDSVDFLTRRAAIQQSLGIYVNSVDPGAVLAPSPNGASILMAAPDGNVMLYEASADTFTISRKDVAALQGPYAASSYNSYVVGNSLLNASLVPVGTLETTSGTASGFAFVGQSGFRTTAATGYSPGVIERVDITNGSVKPTPMVEGPLVPSAAMPFTRTLAPLADQSAVISLTVSGFTVLPWNYDAAVAPPKIVSVVNAADGTKPVAPGGLISVYGQQMSPVNIATQQIPLPTALGESCLTVNGIAVPMLFVSSQQINGQLPVNVYGNATMTLKTPGGISDNFYFSILPAAPSIFRSGTAGPETGLATVFRDDNGQLITPTNPIHPGDIITIYATGMGRVSPPVDSGMPAPADPLSQTVIAPVVTLGGVALNVLYAGLVPGEVGVNQINASVPGGVPQGMDIPLVVTQGGSATELSVRVVK